VKGIAIGLMAFFALVGGAMYFAKHTLNGMEMEERTRGCVVEFADNVTWPSELTVKKGHALAVRGWSADTERGVIPDRVELLFADGGNEVAVGSSSPSIDRPDVAAEFHKPALKRSGFSVIANTSALQPGHWQIRVREYLPDRSVVCYSDKAVHIEE
jgi:hypothetical protein